MTIDLTKILESKRALRREMAARPVAEKLRMLEAMRERDGAIDRRRADRHSGATPFPSIPKISGDD